MSYTLDKRCFKIDKGNAKAMIEGVSAQNKKFYQTIWCDVKTLPFPMLITLNRSPSKFTMSNIGNRLNPEDFSMPLSYIAIGVKEYFIKNTIELWNNLCTNELFDIWEPQAPFERFENAKTDPSKYRIILLRIFEIKEKFEDKDIYHASSRIDHLLTNNREVTIRKPIISDSDFGKIKDRLETSVKPYLQ